MAYNPVPTVATGDLWTASSHNTYIRDNFAAGVPDLFTAAGDLVYGTGANAAARLAIGANGKPLVVSSGLPAWGNFPTPPTVFPIRFGKVETTTIWNFNSPTYTDITNLSLDISMSNSGIIVAIATGLFRIQGVLDEASMRLVIDGTANPIVGQYKRYMTDDQSQANLVQVYSKLVGSGTRNIKLQAANTGNLVSGISLYWGNIVVMGCEGQS